MSYIQVLYAELSVLIIYDIYFYMAKNTWLIFTSKIIYQYTT